MIKTARLTIWLLCISFIVLLIHDASLYPQYSWSEALFTAFLRLLVPFLTVCLTYLFRPEMSKRKWSSALYSLLWLFIIPYSFYNVTQVRHISELCRLAQRGFFAGYCDDLIWSILPPLVYSIGSLAVFFFCTDRLSSFMKKPYDNLFLLVIFLYSSFATVVGIYSRLDTFTMFLDFRTTIAALCSNLGNMQFWLNVFAYFVFAIVVYFSGRSLLKQMSGNVKGRSKNISQPIRSAATKKIIRD